MLTLVLVLTRCGSLLAARENGTVTLNNGVTMPKLAFAANVWPAGVCRNATSEALDAGFRFVWSSFLVGAECQRAQRSAIESASVPRASIFLAGTVDTQSCTSEASCLSATHAGALDQFSYLGPEPLDQLMLDYPSAAGCDGIRGQWSALTTLYRAQRVRSIGVSNFGDEQLACLLPVDSTSVATVVPAVNQLRFSIGNTGPPATLEHNAAHGIWVQAYSPLGSGAILRDKDVMRIGQHHAKSAAQVALRYVLQKNVTIATQSTSPSHLREDLGLFGWDLTDDEMGVLDRK